MLAIEKDQSPKKKKVFNELRTYINPYKDMSVDQMLVD